MTDVGRDGRCVVGRALALTLALSACGGPPAPVDDAPGAPDDALVTHTIDGVSGVPRLRVRVPPFVQPWNITDPPVVFMFREHRPVDQPFHASVALQPQAQRHGDPHCGLVGFNPRETAPTREVAGIGRQVLRCEAADQRGVIVDRWLVDARSGDAFYCIASWWWDGPGPLPDRWTSVAAAIEDVCDDLVIPLLP